MERIQQNLPNLYQRVFVRQHKIKNLDSSFVDDHNIQVSCVIKVIISMSNPKIVAHQ